MIEQFNPNSIPIWVHIEKFNSNSIPIHLNAIPIQFQFRLQILKLHMDLAITRPLATAHCQLTTQQLYPSEYVLASIHTSPTSVLYVVQCFDVSICNSCG